MPLAKYDKEFGGKKGSATKAHAAMVEHYGEKKGEQVFYATKNAHKSEHHSHVGTAENMKPWGPDESKVSDQNAPLRDLHKGGHDLNHSYKNPVAFVSPDVQAAGTNHSYLHPLSHAGMREAPKLTWQKPNTIKPIMDMGTGKK